MLNEVNKNNMSNEEQDNIIYNINNRLSYIEESIMKLNSAIDPSHYYKKPIYSELANIKNILITLINELNLMCEDSDLNFITFKKLSTYKDKFKNILYQID